MGLEVEQLMLIPIPLLLLMVKIEVPSSTLQELSTMEEAQAEEAHMKAHCPGEVPLRGRMAHESGT